MPDPAAIGDWLANAPGVDDVTVDGDRLASRNPLAAYDLGGFAKGYALDRCIEHLRERGIENAIVNTGGDLRAIGSRSDRRWRIGIRHPRTDSILATINTDGDDSVFTSGIVSILDDLQIALFFTGQRHAGENLVALLKQRASELGPPIQMCDALSRNMPEELDTILANCLSHGRRRFVDVAMNFPQKCLYVLEILKDVYANDAEAKSQGMSDQQRLQFHHFSHERAWELGCALKRAAEEREARVAIDISMNGLAFRYSAQENPQDDSSDIEVIFPQNSFSTGMLPFTMVSDCKSAGFFSTLIGKQGRRRSVQFGNLSKEQRAKLASFIEKYCWKIKE